jgi:PAS domain S-box-containing protein
MTGLVYVGVTLVIASLTYGYASRRLRANARRDAGALADANHPFRVIADWAPTLIWLTAPDGARTFCNRSWLEFTGRALDQETGEGWARGVHPIDRPALLSQWRAALAARTPLRAEYRLQRGDGVYRWVLDHGVPRFDSSGAFAGYIGSCVDITDRVRADEAQARLAAIALSSDDAIIGESLDGTITTWNRGAEATFGYAPSEVIGRPVTALVPSDRAPEIESLLSRLRAGEHVEHFETQRVRRDGRRIEVSLTVSPIVDARGRVIGISEIARDITERRRAEETRRRALVDAARANAELEFQKFALDQHAIVAITDGRGRITYVNDRFCELSKYSREELLGQDHRIVNSGHHPRAFFTGLYATISRGEVWQGEICNRAKDGTLYWVDTTIVPFADGEGRPTRYVAIRSDITRRKQTESQLEHALDWKETMLQRERALLRELDHRVRNSLTGLLGLIGIYERSGRSVAETARAIRGKVRAMIHVHELMSPDRGAGATLIDLGSLAGRLADHVASPERRPAVTFGGPKVLLRAKQAGAMAMVLQELLTNSTKHGALARGAPGSVRLDWETGADGQGPWLEVRWADRSPARPEGALEEGVGLRLIRGFVSMELCGQCTFDLGRDGFNAVLRVRPDLDETGLHTRDAEGGIDDHPGSDADPRRRAPAADPRAAVTHPGGGR